MKLFELPVDPNKNLLPSDGTVRYYGKIVKGDVAEQFYNKLLKNIQWEHDVANIFGKKIVTKRKVAWYADEPFDYTYSNSTKTALPWSDELLELKKLIEKTTGEKFNSCLLNLYHDGTEGMAWHSDGEKDLKKNGPIASMSFGAERKFAFKHKQNKDVISLILEHGSLLIMEGTTQKNWLHRLPPTKKTLSSRVNLTFRIIDKT